MPLPKVFKDLESMLPQFKQGSSYDTKKQYVFRNFSNRQVIDDLITWQFENPVSLLIMDEPRFMEVELQEDYHLTMYAYALKKFWEIYKGTTIKFARQDTQDPFTTQFLLEGDGYRLEMETDADKDYIIFQFNDSPYLREVVSEFREVLRNQH